MPRSRSTASRATRPRRTPPARTVAPTAVRLHEALGSSPRSWDAAVTDAVRNAKENAAEPIAVEVGRLWADLDGGNAIRLYRASVKVAYRQALTAPARATKRATRKRAGRT
jgi:flavin-binding protein dodecin